MSVKVEIANPKEVKKYMKELSTEATKTMGLALGKASIYVQGEVKLSIAGEKAEPKSVDTGRFLNSVGIRKKEDYAEVYSDLSYAKHLEYGTKKFAGRRHFKNTSSRTHDRVKKIFRDNIKETIKKVGFKKARYI